MWVVGALAEGRWGVGGAKSIQKSLFLHVKCILLLALATSVSCWCVNLVEKGGNVGSRGAC